MAGAVLFAPSRARAQTTDSIPLSGTMAQNCTISVTPTASATALDLTDGAKHVDIGSIVQNCNKKTGYRITVDTDNCSVGTPGAKLIGAATTPETLSFSVEFANPTTGGSDASVTGLLSTQCTGDAYILGRETTGVKISAETSTVYANYTGDSGLAADTYTDTLRITMTVN
jgi:hypothetical protein